MTRAYCYQCNKALQACICGLTSKVDNPVNICVLQHPTETKNAKGSAIIAKLYLQNYQCLTGEDFSANQQLNTLIEKYSATTFVVYPSANALSFSHCMKEVVNDSLKQGGLEKINLIFIDATWRKASKIWHLSSNLHSLPCIKLNPETRSNYRIRKAPQDNCLSTIEAIVMSLGQLENNQKKYRPLLKVFDKMINFQINKMGGDVYQRNYVD